MSVEKETLARRGSTETCNPREAEVGRFQGQGLPELLRKFSLSGKGKSGGRGRGRESMTVRSRGRTLWQYIVNVQ